MTIAAPLRPELREDLDPRRGECLLCYVDRMLARRDCSGGFTLTAWWRELRAPRATSLVPRLQDVGASCDCELLTRVYREAPSLVPRRASAWDRPACPGVRHGSAQPCPTWQRRPTWD